MKVRTCEAMLDLTIGAPGPISKASLVCDLPEGHESLHHDEQDRVWWRPDETLLPDDGS
jgi:hypothetical protein